MDPVEIVSLVLAQNKWHPGCPPEYLPALARDILYALNSRQAAVVSLPEPDEREEHRIRWGEEDWAVRLDVSPGSVRGEVEVLTKRWLGADDARAFAAAIIAAVDLSS